MQVSIDCEDPEGLATFWAQVLGYRVADPPNGHSSWLEFSAAEAEEAEEKWCIVVDPDDVGPRVLFHRVPESKTTKNRIHLDVWVTPRDGDWQIVDAEVERLVALGATEVRRVAERDQCFVVMADPEGNEFCVCG